MTRTPSPAQLAHLRTGTGTAATIRSCRIAGWIDRDGNRTALGRDALARVTAKEERSAA
jgi:YD repeat-containing protein